MPLVRRSGSRALGTGLLVVVFTAARGAARTARARADAADQNATTLRAEADALAEPLLQPRSIVSTPSTTTSRATEQLVERPRRAREEGARQRARACARRVHDVGLTALDAGRRERHTRHRAARAPHRPRERARPERVREVAGGDARAAQAAARAARRRVRRRPTRSSQLRDEGAAIDAKLAQAAQQEQAAQAVVAAAAATAADGRRRPGRPAPRPPSPPRPRPGGGHRPLEHDRPTTTTTTAPPSRPGPAARLLGHPGHEPAPRRPVPHAASVNGRAAGTTAR